MSRKTSRLAPLFLVSVGALAALPAAAIPVDYSIGLISGRVRFDLDVGGSNEYRYELENIGGLLDDTNTNNDFRDNEPGGENNASAQFTDNGVILDWFSLENVWSTQGFVFEIRNFLPRPAPAAPVLGLNVWRNVSFILDMQVTFFDNKGTVELDDDDSYDTVFLEDFEIPLLTMGGDPIDLNPGGWFRASYEIGSLTGPTGPMGPLSSAQRRVEVELDDDDDDYVEGFLITASVPDNIFNPIGVDPDPDPNPNPTSVPEPATLALLALGLMGLGASGARRRRLQGTAAV